ncbi:MAG: hypothetical protein GY920_21775 [Aliivibrio sp.]|nr:hypothetical protein [Aliivibrio sp.]
MLDKVIGFFSGGAMSSIENIASEWIETKKETAEAETLMLKTLDPNGMMRRELSRKVSQLYGVYLITSLALLGIEFFCVIFGVDIDLEQLAVTTNKVTDLFLPISALFGAIVTASFGVNYANTKQGN